MQVRLQPEGQEEKSLSRDTGEESHQVRIYLPSVSQQLVCSFPLTSDPL